MLGYSKNKKQLINGEEEWRKIGREKMTSDVLAVCEAVNEFGIDEVLYYDAHYAGNLEFNVIVEKLPTIKEFWLNDMIALRKV